MNYLQEKTIKKLKCLICRKSFKHLGSHVWHSHKMLSREYKIRFSLPYTMSLISENVREKMSIANRRNNASEWLIPYRELHAFKKGRTGQRRISDLERKKIAEQLKGIQSRTSKYETCPVCSLKFKHLSSHLYQAHSLLKIDKTKE